MKKSSTFTNDHRSGHVFVKWGDKYFDSVNPEGLDLLRSLSFGEDMKVSEQDYETQKKSWVHETDELGLAILEDWKEVLRTKRIRINNERSR